MTREPNVQLRRHREMRGWSQNRIAEEIGTCPDIVSRWERGIAKPNPYYRERLCQLFGKDAVELGFVEARRSEVSGDAVAVVNQVTSHSSQLRFPVFVPADEGQAGDRTQSLMLVYCSTGQYLPFRFFGGAVGCYVGRFVADDQGSFFFSCYCDQQTGQPVIFAQWGDAVQFSRRLNAESGVIVC